MDANMHVTQCITAADLHCGGANMHVTQHIMAADLHFNGC